MTVVFDPENWTPTLFRALKTYIESKVDPPGIYNIIGSFPPTSLLTERQPIDRTIIHFEFDDIRNPRLGFGDNVVDNIYDDNAGTVVPIEGKPHVVNCDMGIWASERSGAETARLEAYKFLTEIFVGTLAYRELRDVWAIEVISFDGANFILEEVNDIPLWRVAGMTLVVRVFSRTLQQPAIPYIDYTGVTQEPNFEDIDGNPITDNES